MRNFFTAGLLKAMTVAVVLLSNVTGINAQRHWNDIDTSGYYKIDSSTRDGFTLVFISKDSSFSAVTHDRMTEAFFKVYPQEVKRFNPMSPARVVFVVDSSYKGVAATSHGIVRYNPGWLQKHPEDLDVVTHEVMHIVQDYKGGGEGWLTEGIADYVRYKYGVNNTNGNWALPQFKPAQKYTDSYRITARFLAWLEKNVRPAIVDELDAASRNGKYSSATWKELTGKTVDELWLDYAANPVL